MLTRIRTIPAALFITLSSTLLANLEDTTAPTVQVSVIRTAGIISRDAPIKRANGYSLVELKLETGRKNQIRVHMSDLGHPVVGDERYGSECNPLGRLALHAFKLCFYHPVTGELMEFETPYPSAFKSIMLRKPQP